MAVTLGLDIGTNSIGWALIAQDHVIDLGVRIFPVGVKEDSFNKSGTEESKNSARRSARGIRRGYDRFDLRRDRLLQLLLANGMNPNGDLTQLPAKDLFGLRKRALDEKLSLEEIGRVLFHLNQRRGFKSNRKSDAGKSSETGPVKEGIKQLRELLQASGARTIGEYFYNQFNGSQNPHHPETRIRKRFVGREMYEHEFDTIWSAQQRYHPQVLTDELRHLIRNKAIFYQRDLKPQTGRVRKCSLEPTKRVGPKSSPDFQEYRMWTNIMNLRITDPDSGRVNEPLTPLEREKLAEIMLVTEELLTKDDDLKPTIKKELGLPKDASFNEMPDDLKGHVTYARIAKAIGKEYFLALPEEARYRLWHTLYFASSDEWLKNHAVEKLGLSMEQAEKYFNVSLEDGYGRLSTRAIRKLLPFIKDGNDLYEAQRLAGYIKEDQPNGAKTDRIERKPGDTIELIPNPLVKQSMCEAIRVINAIIKKYGKPDEVHIEMARSLKKPKKVREGMKRANDEKDRLRDEYRKFICEKKGWTSVSDRDIQKFELWLEMEFAEQDLEKIKAQIDINEFFKFSYKVNPKDKEKFKLWLECGRLSPYTGKVITLSELFSAEIEIEHIIPYSRCLDNSFINKTLCERSFNADKKNQSPWEIFGHDTEGWKSFVRRVRFFSRPKQNRFLMKEIKDDFLNSQLTNTSYIARELKSVLDTVFDNVRITNGQATAILRRLWGMNSILNSEANEKTRNDHRHHAIDAAVIAATKPAHINLMSRYSQFNHQGKPTNDHITEPFPLFRQEVQGKIYQTLVSYRNKSRLLTKSINKYKWSQSKRDIAKTVLAPRGALHAETFYGQIHDSQSGEPRYVIRKDITTFDKESQVEDIVDPVIREILSEAVKRNNGNVKAAMKEPLYLTSKDGKTKTQIKSVRVFYESNTLEQLRPEENPKLFVEPGDNYCIAIYENEKGKRKFKTVSFFQAVKRAKECKPLFPAMLDDFRLLYALKKKDLVVMYDKHPDEIKWDDKDYLYSRLYRIVKFDQTGTIGFALHNLSNVSPNKPIPGVAFRKAYGSVKIAPVLIDNVGNVIR